MAQPMVKVLWLTCILKYCDLVLIYCVTWNCKYQLLLLILVVNKKSFSSISLWSGVTFTFCLFVTSLVAVQPTRQRAPSSLLPLRNNSNISIIPRNAPRGPNKPLMRLLGANRGAKQPVAAAKPYFGEGSAHPPVTVSVCTITSYKCITQASK